MKATIDGIEYEGTEDEIRRIVENPPRRPCMNITEWPPRDCPKNWDGSPRVTCKAGADGPR